jgi:DNA-binding SARP family transcriptional activator/tetratricopeptide (TPR) repeat protein
MNVEIALLGEWRIRAGRSRVVLPSKKAQALVAYLALSPGRRHEREHLQGLLWGEAPRERAQANLRQTLLVLRSALPEAARSVLVTEGTALALDDARASVDVARLEAEAASASRETLESVTALCKGPLLDGFTLDEPSFDDWLRTARARIGAIAMRALERLAELQETDGAVERSIETLQHVLRFDAAREDVHRRIMRLYAAQGRGGEARRQFRICTEALKRELDVDPEESTRRLFDELQRVSPRTATRRDASIDSRRAAPRAPMIGRVTELDRLVDAFVDAWAQAPLLGVVSGDAGVGKTRLLEAVAERAGARGGRVVWGHAFDSEQALPFALWSDLLRREADLSGHDRWSALSADARAELERLLPGRRGPKPRSPPEAHEVLGLFEAFSLMVSSAARAAPLLIVLEDIHWADAMSVRLLSFLARRAGPRVALLASLRPGETGRGSLLAGSLQEIHRAQRRVDVVLEPLSRDETLTLARTLAGGARVVDRAFEPIWILSEGNPLVVVEAVRGLRGGSVASEVAPLPVPERIRSLIADHAARLPRLAQDILSTASVIGREFDFDWLSAACDADEREVARTLEDLVAMRFLETHGERLSFAHDRIREVLFDGLLPPRRRLLHRAVAVALERTSAGRLDEVSGILGHHYARAGDASASVVHLTAFADRCLERYGLEEALAALDEALTQANRLLPERGDAPSIEIANRRAQCLFSLGRFTEMEPALALGQASVDRLDAPFQAAPFYAWRAVAQCYVGDGRRALEHGERALCEAERCGDVLTAGSVHMVLAHNAFHLGQFRRGVEHGLEAIARLEDIHGAARDLTSAWMHLGRNRMALGEWRRGLDAYRRAGAIAESSGTAAMRSQITAATGLIHLVVGDAGQAAALCARAVQLAPDPFSRVWASWATARVGAALGRTDDEASAAALDVLEEAERVATSSGPRGWTALIKVALAEVYLAKGDAGRARATAGEALAGYRETGDPLGRGWALRILALSEHALGEARAARTRLDEAVTVFGAIEARTEVAWTTFRCGLLELEAGDRRRARKLLDDSVRLFSDLDLELPASLAAESAKVVSAD